MGRGRSRDLLGDSDSEEGKGVAEITINEAFAKRFAHNKQREALHRLQELKKRGLALDSEDDDESSDEDEDEDGLLPERTDVQFYETLTKIKNKDPSIYQKGAKLYDDSEEEQEQDAEDGGKSRDEGKKKKPLYLKDVVARQLLEHGPDFDEKYVRKPPKSYAEEQDELKRAFWLGAQEGSDEDGEDGGRFLTVKKKTAEELVQEKKEEEEAIAEAERRAKDADIVRRLNDYFGRDDDLDENEKFLKGYLLNKGWIDREQQAKFSYDDIQGISEDEEEIDKQDKFEAEYNFRFEEGAGDQVLGHARFTEGSVRKKPNARKVQRENKQSRLALAEFERKEELKHLKNIKKRDILEKLEKIRNVAGVGSQHCQLLDEEDLDADFDPEEYDRKMRETFGDEYYDADDADENFQGYDMDGLEKPNFDAEDELLGLPKGWDGLEGKEGFAAARMKAKRLKAENEDSHGDSEEKDLLQETIIRDSDAKNGSSAEHDVAEVEEIAKSERKLKGRISLREKLAFDKHLEEYYKLDYEDMIGDLPTRFKYRQVSSNNYGLTVEEILMTEDQELNQYVSLKKLAPYRTKEWKVSKHHGFSQKRRKKMALEGGKSNDSNGIKKLKSKTEGDAKRAASGSNGRDGNHAGDMCNTEHSTSKQSEKRRRKGAPVLPWSRLMAYGKLSKNS